MLIPLFQNYLKLCGPEGWVHWWAGPRQRVDPDSCMFNRPEKDKCLKDIFQIPVN
jgi:hypothetical protein